MKRSIIHPAIHLAVGALLLALPSGVAAASDGAWNREEDGYFVKFGFTSLTADEEYDFAGRLRGLFRDSLSFGDAEFGVSTFTFYAEYGLLDWFTGVVSTQFNVAVRSATYLPTGVPVTASASGLGDIWLGGRVRLLPTGGPVAASITAAWKVPTGSPHQQIPLGSGRADYELDGSLGSGFALGAVTGYGQVSAGYRLRGGVADEITYLAELGVNVGSRTIVHGVVDGIGSGTDFPAAARALGDGIGGTGILPSQSFLRWTLGAIYATSAGFELSIDYSRQESGRNALASSAVALGITWKR